MVTYIAMTVIQLRAIKDEERKMKLFTRILTRLLPLVLTLLVLGCNDEEQQLKWQGRCFPHQFLSEASFITSNNGDKAFDSEVSDAPILFFPADYVVKQIKEFQAFEYRNNGQYNHFLPVNFQPMRKLKQETDATLFKTFVDAQDLYITKEREQYSFTLYTKTEDKFLYWGFCSHGTVDNYNCFRTIEFGKMNIRYMVNKDNISIHKKIDAFIFEHLDKWRCE